MLLDRSDLYDAKVYAAHCAGPFHTVLKDSLYCNWPKGPQIFKHGESCGRRNDLPRDRMFWG
jgi:hypothetical protein